MPRVFSAVRITEKELLEELEQVRDRMDLGFNPVETEKMHVTLEFFENVSEEELKNLKRAIRNVDFEPFRASVKGLGAFPSVDHIRVVWAGFDDERSFHQLNQQVSDHNVDNDNSNSFKPHITLLRVRNVSGERKRKLQRTLREFQLHEFGEAKVDKVKLYRSELGNGGTNYTVLEEKKL